MRKKPFISRIVGSTEADHDELLHLANKMADLGSALLALNELLIQGQGKVERSRQRDRSAGGSAQ